MQMTHEDEEFNRIEMESRIRQEGVRAMSDAKSKKIDMTKQELDAMWSIATRKAIEKNEPYTRYEFAKLVAEKVRGES